MKSDTNSDFSNRFARLSNTTGRKVAQLCRDMGVSRTQIYDIKNCKIPVSEKMWTLLEKEEQKAGVRTERQQEWDETNAILEELPPDLAYNSKRPGIAKGWVMAQECALKLALKKLKGPLNAEEQSELTYMLGRVNDPRERDAVMHCIKVADAQVMAAIQVQLIKNELEATQSAEAPKQGNAKTA